MKKVFTFILLFSLILNIKALENNIFSIDIPDSYKETLNKNNVYKWEKDNNYIAITVDSNIELKYNVQAYTEKDIIKQKDYIETNINKGLEQYNLKATVSNITKNNINDLYYIEYSIYYPTKETTGHDIYQKGRMYTTNNYILTIIYNSDKEIKDEDYNKIVDTLTIKDDYKVIRSANKERMTKLTFIAGLVFAIIFLLIQYKRRL